MTQPQSSFEQSFTDTTSQQAREASTILINRNLFSSYYLGTLFDKTVRAQQGEIGMRMPRNVRTRLQNRWDKYTPTLGSSSYQRTREAWLETLFIALGYEPLDKAHPADFKETKLPDGYFLYSPPATTELPNLPTLSPLSSPDEGHPVALPLFQDEDDDSDREGYDETSSDTTPIEPSSEERGDHAVLISLLSWSSDFDRPFTTKARRSEVPHKLMERLLASGGPARWGLLCNGRRIRLLKRDVVAGRQHYYEVDLEALFDNRDERDASRKEQGFDTFWTLFRAQAFQPGPDGRCLLDILDQESRKHAEGVSTRLKTSVFQALETLMSSLVQRARMLTTIPDSTLAALEQPLRSREEHRRTLAQQALADLPTLYTQSLVFLYRLLFVLYAESRTLLPVDNAIYRDAYSLDPLRAEIEEPGAEIRYQPDSFRLWETLQVLFRLIHRGCNTTQLVVPAYNGNLFDPQGSSFLHAIRIPDNALYQMLQLLSVTPKTKDRGRERIDYRDLGVEQLGAVYEGLLEFEPRVATEPMVEVRHKDLQVVIPAREQRTYKVLRPFAIGEFYLGRGAGRKTSGSYYTPQPLVDFLVERTLGPLVQGKKPEEILELKVVDPAMGSGAFLVGACLYLADAYARALREQERLNRPSIQPESAQEQEISQDESDNESNTLLFNLNAASTEDAAEITLTNTSEDGTLSEEATRPYRRLVAERCLYGVDLNPMAVELAKVSLWLTTLAGDKPLTFLDANLRYGNSLVGAPLHMAGHGQENLYTIYTIHPEANKRLARARGDSLETRTAKRSRQLWDEDEDAEGQEQQPSLLDEIDDITDTIPTLVDNRRLIAEQPSDTVAQVHEKAAIFQQQIVGDSKRKMLEQICNLWIATWFWKQPSKTMKPTEPAWVPPLDGRIYAQLVNYIRAQYQEQSGIVQINTAPYLKEVANITKEVHPFHWELEFPEIYFEPDGRPRANPGFSAVLGNPPWDIIKPNSREFFSEYDPGFRELERATADKRRIELLTDLQISTLWDIYQRLLENQADYTHSSEMFLHQSTKIDGKQTGGDVNTYKLFLEKAYNLLSREGLYGIIAPSGLYTDQGCTGLRKLFLKQARISYLYCFENRKGIFPIDSRFKFILFGVQKAQTSEIFDAAFMIHNLDALSSIEAYTIHLPTHLIEQLSSGSLSILEFRLQQDVDTIQKIYRDQPSLAESIDGTWKATINSEEFHMTYDRNFFNEDKQGWPLYEGKMLHQYTHKFNQPRYWIDSKQGDDELSRREIRRVRDALVNYLQQQSKIKLRNPQAYKDYVTELLKRRRKGPLTSNDVCIDTEVPRLAFRDISGSTNERTMIASILPPHIFEGNTLKHFHPRRFKAEKAIENIENLKECYELALPQNITAFLCDVLNSFVLDYVLRFKVSTHVSTFYVYQLPVPHLTPNDIHCRAIARRVAQLVCIGPEFDELRRELLGSVTAHVATIHDERQHLQNEIDALVAHLYGLREEDLTHILYAPYTFPLVKREIKDGVMAAFAQVEQLLKTEVS